MEPPTIISLTSIPPRFAHLGPTLRALVGQDLPAAAVVLAVPRQYRRFPGWDGRLPEVPAGVTILRCAEDHGPATKILAVLRALAAPDRGAGAGLGALDWGAGEPDILFCDDDCLYPLGWHRAFKAARGMHPRACLAGSAQHLPGLEASPRPGRMPRMQRWTPAALRRAAGGPGGVAPPPVIRQAGHADLVEGWAGVMLRPSFLHQGVFDLPPVLWTVDDPWISGHLERAGTPIWAFDTAPPPRRRHDVGGIEGLVASVIEGHDRDAADLACIRHCQRAFGIWQERPPVLARLALALRRMVRRVVPRARRHRLLQLYARLRGW